MYLKIILFIAGGLFVINWVCTLSSQKFKGYRWGDFIIIVLFIVLAIMNFQRLKALGKAVPDKLDLAIFRINKKVSDTLEESGLNAEKVKDIDAEKIMQGVYQETIDRLKYSNPNIE